MIQLINKLKKNQKGFTLVELIVVLVILAILAAFTIPAMLGFVNDAKGKAYVAEARLVYMAYQGAVSEFAGDNTAATDTAINRVYKDTTTYDGDSIAQKVQKSALAKLVGDIVTETIAGDKTTYTVQPNTHFQVTVASRKVSEVKYLKGGYLVTIDYTKDAGSGAVVEKSDLTGF